MENKSNVWWWVLGVVLVVVIAWFGVWNKGPAIEGTGPIKVGWISDLTGPQAKYGAFEAGTLAMEEINQKGGISSRPLQIIFEDGKCNGATAASAMQKLVNVDKVSVVIGGHCSPESLIMAPIAEQNHVVMLASITTSPGLTDGGDYVFRTSPVSTAYASIIAEYMLKELELKTMGVVFEQTDYARPIAEALKRDFEDGGGRVVVFESYNPGTNDFRTVVSKIRTLKPDAVFIAPQSPDAGFNLLKQMDELGVNTRMFGSDALVNQVSIDENPSLFEGLILAQPDFDENTNSLTKKFVDAYKARFKTGLPYGIWTAESYDAVYIIADAIAKSGGSADGVRGYLNNLKDYKGASGLINFDSNGDGVRTYKLKIITGGKVSNLSQ